MTASAAYAQTATDNGVRTVPGDTPNNVPDPVDGGLSTQQETMVPPPTVVDYPAEQDFVATLMWLVPLIAAVLLIAPVFKRWNERRRSRTPATPRV